MSLPAASHTPKLYRYNSFRFANYHGAWLTEDHRAGLDEMDKIAKETLDDSFRTALTGDSRSIAKAPPV